MLKTYERQQVFFVDGGSEWSCNCGSYEDLLSMNQARRARLRLVTGHMPIQTLELFDNPFAFTIMRNPVDRALSDYWYCYHAMHNPAHPFARRLSIAEFCRQSYGQAKNGQARYLSGVVYSGEQLADDELLKRAQATLSRFDLVGLHEDIDVFLKRFAEKTRIHDLVMSSGDQNAAERLRTPSSEDLIAIQESNKIDFMLFDMARKLNVPTEPADSILDSPAL